MVKTTTVYVLDDTMFHTSTRRDVSTNDFEHYHHDSNVVNWPSGFSKSRKFQSPIFAARQAYPQQHEELTAEQRCYQESEGGYPSDERSQRAMNYSPSHR